jgi:hypothetical protein
MASFAGPNLITDGIVLSLDVGNKKSYKYRPGPQDHGISNYYCFVDGTATYSAIYPNTEIIEIDANGVRVGIVTTGSDPQRGTFTTTAGRRYYGTKAVHLLNESQGDHRLAPVSFAGTYFAHYWSRNSPETYYAYAPFEDVTLEFFDNDTAGGVTGIVTATHNISKGFTTSFQSTSAVTWQFFKSDNPIIMTAAGSSGDRTILAPATQYVYTRRNGNERTINNTAPSNAGGTYVIYDTSLPVAHNEIGDGAGGDCTQGIGYEYLSDTYSWGNVLSDYQIVTPYADTTIKVSYWDTGTSSWVVGETHSLSGTQTSPDAVDRDGTNGFGIGGTIISGAANDLASGANLWKFEGTQSFALIINDSVQDEERLLGWMKNNAIRNSDDQIFDLSRNGNTGTLTDGPTFDGANIGSLSFDGSDDYVDTGTSFLKTNDNVTLEAFINHDSNSGTHFFLYEGQSDGFGTPVEFHFHVDSGYLQVFFTGISLGGSSVSAASITAGEWNHVAVVFSNLSNVSGASSKLYLNAVEIDSVSGATVDIGSMPTSNLLIGKPFSTSQGRLYNGKVAAVKVYNKSLTVQEIKKNFNATRRRYGI